MTDLRISLQRTIQLLPYCLVYQVSPNITTSQNEEEKDLNLLSMQKDTKKHSIKNYFWYPNSNTIQITASARI